MVTGMFHLVVPQCVVVDYGILLPFDAAQGDALC